MGSAAGVRVMTRSLREFARVCEEFAVWRKVEPGGFEPPCRYSQCIASTRVVAVLISAHRAAGDSIPNCHDRLKFPSAEACQPFGSSPMSSFHTLSGVEHGTHSSIRLREHTAGWQLLFLHPFYVARMLHDAQRYTFPVRSIPFGPIVKEHAISDISSADKTAEQYILFHWGGHG